MYIDIQNICHQYIKFYQYLTNFQIIPTDSQLIFVVRHKRHDVDFCSSGYIGMIIPEMQPDLLDRLVHNWQTPWQDARYRFHTFVYSYSRDLDRFSWLLVDVGMTSHQYTLW